MKGNCMKQVLVGHSSFYLREGWINKGLDLLKTDNNIGIFSKNNYNTIDTLGIGSVMVQSLKFWLEFIGLVKKENSQYILDKDYELLLELDPFLQNKNSLWYIHYRIMSNEDALAVLWEIVFKNIKFNVFFRENIAYELDKYLIENELKFSERSISDSIDVFLKTYIKKNNILQDPENNLFSPLSNLDYIKENELGEYSIRSISNEEISEYIILMMIYDIKKKNESNFLSKDFLYTYVKSIISMDIYNFEKLISKLEHEKYINIDITAGLNNIIVKREINNEKLINQLLRGVKSYEFI